MATITTVKCYKAQEASPREINSKINVQKSEKICICMSLTSPSPSYRLTKYNNVNLVFNPTKMAKATNKLYEMVWKARKYGQCLTRMKP
jgi:hypothetical protein